MELESRRRLEDSLLWDGQARFYEAQGPRAFAGGTVPWRITSTPIFAQGLAEVISAFARDAAPARPVCVVDLGAGTGRLAALVCEQLLARGTPHRYVMTDVAASNLEAWARHPVLARHAAQGRLDFARADSRRLGGLRLARAGEVWGPGALPGPLVAIAAYQFDTLPHALYRRRGEALEEGRVTLRAPGAGAELGALEWQFDFEPASAPVDAFVRGYARSVPEGPFLVPTGAFACLGALQRLGGGRALCLIADKGPRTAEQLCAAPFPPLARHGSVSAAVNFHALRAWAGWRPWLEAAAPAPDFGVYGVGLGHSEVGLRATRAAFDRSFGGGAPLTDQRALEAAVAGAESLPAEQLVAALAAQRFAPDAFLRLAGALRARAAELSPAHLPALVEALDRAGGLHFELGEERDLFFELGTVLHRAGQLSHAARWYQRSLEARGDHPTTRFNLALCRLDLAELGAARGELERVVALAPEHARARALLAQLGGA